MSDHKVEPIQVACEADFLDDKIRVGVFANAFRILKDTGDEFFLDFLVYSTSEQRATVVSRVRVHKDMVRPIADRFNGIMMDLTNALAAAKVPLMIVPKKDDDDVQ